MNLGDLIQPVRRTQFMGGPMIIVRRCQNLVMSVKARPVNANSVAQKESALKQF